MAFERCQDSHFFSRNSVIQCHFCLWKIIESGTFSNTQVNYMAPRVSFLNILLFVNFYLTLITYLFLKKCILLHREVILIGQQLFKSCRSPYLQTGVTLAILKQYGNEWELFNCFIIGKIFGLFHIIIWYQKNVIILFIYIKKKN